MTRAVVLAALAAGVSAFDGAHAHVRGGMWGAIKNLFHGNGVLDLRPNAADSCCAMHRDGSYYANFSSLADWGDGIQPSFGTFGVNVDDGTMIAYVGGTCLEDSSAGVYVRPVDDAVVATSWCGEAQKCVDHFFAKGALQPSMCFGGEQSLWPDYISSSRIDAMLTANNFADRATNNFVSVNRITCMPLYSLHRFNVSDDDAGAPLWRRLLPPRPPRKALGDVSESWAATMFLNATGNAPPDDVFGMPSYCDDARRVVGK